MKKFIFMLIAIAILVSYSVSANSSEYNLSVLFDDETKILSISGKIGDEGKLPVTVIIDDYSADEKKYSVDSLPKIVDIYKLGDDGTADFAVPIPADMPSGKYSVYFNCNGAGKHTESFIVPASQGSDELVTALDAVNSASASDMGLVIKEYGIALGCDVDVYSREELSYMGSLIGSWRSEDYTVSGFASAFRKAGVINSMKNGESVESVMQKNADVFGVNAGDYAALTAGTKAKLEKFLPKADFEINSASQVYAEILVLSKITGAENWVEMKDEFMAHKDMLELYLTDYEDLSSTAQNMVFTGFFDEKDNIFTLEDAKDRFYDEVESQLPVKNSDASPSGGRGGGGGGGGFVSKGTITAPADIMKPIYDEPTAQPEKNLPVFSDLENHFSKEAVETFISLGIISGYPDGTFKPNAPVTRAEFAKMAVLAFEIKDSGEAVFSDVSEDEWFAPYIKSLYAKNVLKGYDGCVFPDNNLKREDAAVMIQRIMNYKDSEVTLPYDDNNMISDYALGAVSVLFEKEIMRGDGTSFNPQNTITRGEAAVLLSNAVSYYSISKGGE